MNTIQYFKAMDFQNISEARFLLAKAKREQYPTSVVNELEGKIHDYETMVEIDTDMAVFG